MHVSRLLPHMKWLSAKDTTPVPKPATGAAAGDVARLVYALPDPVLILDRTATIAIANDAARAALMQRLEGQHIAVAIRAPAVLDAVAGALAGAAPAHVEYEVRGPLPRAFD